MTTPHRTAYDLGQIDPVLDPGTGGTFLVKGRSLVRVEMKSVGASETRTLPIPSASGQFLQLIHAVDGGDIDITVTSGYNEAATTTMNTATAGDFVTFHSVATAATTYRWRILGYEGFTGITEVEGGNLTVDGALIVTGAATVAGITTNARAVDTRFNPMSRVFAMSSFSGQRLYTGAVVSTFSYMKSVRSAVLDWEVSGSGTVFGGTAGTSGLAGLSGSNSSAYAFCRPVLGTAFNKIAWMANKEPEFDFVIRTGTVIKDENIVVGLFSTTYPRGQAIGKGSSGSNRVEVYCAQNRTSRTGTGSGGSWQVGVAGSGASSAAVATGTNADNATVYHVNIRISSARIVTVYINDMSTAVYTSTLAMTTSKPLIPMIGIQNEGGKGNVQIAHIIGSQNFS